MLRLTVPGIITEMASRTGITHAGSIMEIPSAPILSTALQQQLAAARSSELRSPGAANAGKSIEALIIAVKMNPALQTGQSANDPLLRSNPLAYTITLRVGNEQFEASSDRPLLSGQYIQIKPLPAQRLLVLNPPMENPQIRNLLIQHHLTQQGMRQALPIQQAYAVAIKQMAVLLQNPLAPPYQQVHHYFHRLLQALPRPQQLQTGAGIKQAIQNSGLFLEHKLRGSPASPGALATSGTSARPAGNPGGNIGSGTAGSGGNPALSPGQTELQESAARMLSRIRRPAGQPAARHFPGTTAKLQTSTVKTSTPNQRINPIPDTTREETTADSRQPQPLSETVRSDFKAQLLQLAGLLRSWHTGSRSRPDDSGSRQPSANRDLLENNGLYTARGKLIRNGGMMNSAASIDSTTAADTPEQKMLQQLQSSLARLQLQQLNTLELQHGGQHEATRTGFHLEIPVLTTSGYLDTLQLQVEEEPAGQTAVDSNSKQRVWKIILSFDMEHLGLIHAQLKLIQDSVSATFWAERQETVTAIKQEFAELEHSLENAGIQVTQLQCHQGQPAQTSNRLQQSLIDLKT